jgi:NADPH2:quinone reductase
MMAGPMAELFALVTEGRLRPVIGGTYPMSQVRSAHEDLRGRRTTGKIVLDPTR